MVPGIDEAAREQHSRLRVVSFEPHHAEVFRELNLEWIEEYFAVEELDRRHLYFPRESFVDPGGAILMAELDGFVVGCCALLKHGESVYEVSKMAVRRDHRGGGVGKTLLRAVIDHARSMGAQQLEIISSTRLQPAIRLYKQAGFVETPLESDAYARGNIALVLRLNERD